MRTILFIAAATAAGLALLVAVASSEADPLDTVDAGSDSSTLPDVGSGHGFNPAAAESTCEARSTLPHYVLEGECMKTDEGRRHQNLSWRDERANREYLVMVKPTNIELRSIDRFVSGSVPVDHDGLSLEFLASGNSVAKYSQLREAIVAPDRNGENFHVYASQQEILDDDDGAKLQEKQRFESRAFFYEAAGRLHFSLIFDDLGPITVRLHKGSMLLTEATETLEANPAAYQLLVQVVRTVAQVNHTPPPPPAPVPLAPAPAVSDDEDENLTVFPYIMLAGRPGEPPVQFSPVASGSPTRLLLPVSQQNDFSRTLGVILRAVVQPGSTGTVRVRSDNPSLELLGSDFRPLQDATLSVAKPAGQLAAALVENGVEIRVRGLRDDVRAELTWEHVNAEGQIQATSRLPFYISSREDLLKRPPAAGNNAGAPIAYYVEPPARTNGFPMPAKPFAEIPADVPAKTRAQIINVATRLTALALGE